ncbi:hypothetical protein VPHK449_0084 [Vibrio phage K449]
MRSNINIFCQHSRFIFMSGLISEFGIFGRSWVSFDDTFIIIIIILTKYNNNNMKDKPLVHKAS